MVQGIEMILVGLFSFFLLLLLSIALNQERGKTCAYQCVGECFISFCKSVLLSLFKFIIVFIHFFAIVYFFCLIAANALFWWISNPSTSDSYPPTTATTTLFQRTHKLTVNEATLCTNPFVFTAPFPPNNVLKPNPKPSSANLGHLLASPLKGQSKPQWQSS